MGMVFSAFMSHRKASISMSISFITSQKFVTGALTLQQCNLKGKKFNLSYDFKGLWMCFFVSSVPQANLKKKTKKKNCMFLTPFLSSSPFDIRPP